MDGTREFRCVRLVAGVKGCVRARGGGGQAVTRTSRNEMLNTSGSRRIMLENLVMATARGRRWYATTVKNVLDRAVVEGVKEAA